MNEEEVKAAIAEALAAQKAEHDAETAGLKTHAQTLLDEVKQYKASEKAAKEAAEKATRDAALASNDVEAIKATLTTEYSTKLEAIEAALAKSESQRSTLMIDNAIQANFDKLNVQAKMRKPLAAMLKQSAALDGDVAKIGDKELNAYMAEYFASEEGLEYISAPENSGSPAQQQRNNTVVEDAKKGGLAGQIAALNK